LDLGHLDEAGFAPTQPTTYSWSPVGERLTVAYEAPQGRRVNAIGVYFSHGPQAGDFQFESYASLPKSKAKKRRKSLAEQAEAHGLRPEEVGVLDSDRFLAFVWRVAGRPEDAATDWQRERPLVLVLDNYSVHQCEAVQLALPALNAADIFLFYLPAYCPALSQIEPIWQDVKHRELVVRSQPQLGDLKQSVDAALARKAASLRHSRSETTNSPLLTA
jgi:hypothetical protein